METLKRITQVSLTLWNIRGRALLVHFGSEQRSEVFNY